MNRSVFPRRRVKRVAQDKANPAWHEQQDMLKRKETLCEELIRIDTVVEKLAQRRRIGPDVSAEDLLEIFWEERERLFAQLRQVDAVMAESEAENTDPVSYCRVIELRRSALVSDSPLDFR